MSDINIRGTFTSVIYHRNHVARGGVGHGYAASLRALQLLGAPVVTQAFVSADVHRTLSGVERLYDAFSIQVSGRCVCFGGVVVVSPIPVISRRCMCR